MQRALAIPVCLTLLCLAGCGSSAPTPVIVAGKVTFDGKPVAEGHIVFKSVGGPPSEQSGEIIDGRFNLDVTPGPKRVEIIGNRDVAGTAPSGMRSGPKENFIPARFNTSSTLSADISPTGENTLTFELKTK